MLDLLGRLASHLLAGTRPQPCAIATLIGTYGSTPRAVGTSMLVTAGGEVSGSLSGGCVEGAVFEACQQAIVSGVPSRERYGFTGEDAFAVGLPCGGSLEVLIQPFYPPHPGQKFALESFAPAASSAAAALIRRIDNDEVSAIVVTNPLEFEPDDVSTQLLAMVGENSVASNAAAQLKTLIRTGQTAILSLEIGKTGSSGHLLELLVETRLPAPSLLMFGANDFSAALGKAASLLGFHVTLCDARAVFSTRAAFPFVDELITEHPDRYLRRIIEANTLDGRSAICVLTHDEKFDIPVLETALGLGIGYVGAMGSRRSHEHRFQSLRERGIDEGDLARLHSPIGLNLGAITPEEVAVSIVAEIIANRRGKPNTTSLSATHEPLHGQSSAMLSAFDASLR
jgi:xanthine dehydrogenase accessory factor